MRKSVHDSTKISQLHKVRNNKEANHEDCSRAGRWGRVSCSILSGLFGPIGLLRGGHKEAREEEDEVIRLGTFRLVGGNSWWW